MQKLYSGIASLHKCRFEPPSVQECDATNALLKFFSRLNKTPSSIAHKYFNTSAPIASVPNILSLGVFASAMSRVRKPAFNT